MKVHTSTANDGANAKIIAPTRNTTELMTIARRLPIKSTIKPIKTDDTKSHVEHTCSPMYQ